MIDDRGMHPIYFDTEFTGLHQNTTLISIGCVSGTGNYFYAELTDYDRKQVDDWIADNVIYNLLWHDGYNSKGYTGPGVVQTIKSIMDQDHNYRFNVKVYGNTKEVSEALRMWLQNESAISGKKIQMYSDCLAYDWVLFNNLLCTKDATDMPDWIYYIPMDLCTALQAGGIDPDISREEFANPEHILSFDRGPVIKFIREISKNASPKHNALWDALIIRECFYNTY